MLCDSIVKLRVKHNDRTVELKGLYVDSSLFIFRDTTTGKIMDVQLGDVKHKVVGRARLSSGESDLLRDYVKQRLVKHKLIVIATTNEGKLREFKRLLEPMGYQVKSLKDFPNLDDVEETEDTFEGNARLKADTISRELGHMVIADDSGLCVDALGGRPGVYSARYAGDHDELANNRKLLEELRPYPNKKDRSARYITVMVASYPNGKTLVSKGILEGYITHKERGTNGFAYDVLFELEDGRTVAELDIDSKNKVSHRAIALKGLINKINKN